MNYKKSLKPFFKKRHLIEITSIILLLILASAFKITSEHLNNMNSNKNFIATLSLNFDNVNRFFEGEVLEDMTMLDALNMATTVGKIKFNYILNDQNLTLIMEINDHKNETGDRKFLFFINDKKIDSEDLNKVLVKAGDSMVITYE